MTELVEFVAIVAAAMGVLTLVVLLVWTQVNRRREARRMRDHFRNKIR
jgi:hypothetical protein